MKPIKATIKKVGNCYIVNSDVGHVKDSSNNVKKFLTVKGAIEWCTNKYGFIF